MAKRRHDALDPDFWKNIDVKGPDECWEWQRARKWGGYGQMHYQGQKRGAHTVAYELTYGPVPEGLHILHSCDNPPCCNPAHLRAGTPSENQYESIRKGRHNSCTGRNLYQRKGK